MRCLHPALQLIAVLIVLPFLLTACEKPGEGPDPNDGGPTEVTVFTSTDQVYAEEIFAAFTEETGVKVNPKFDTEAAKTTGLYNQLVAQKERPVADVFWNNEIARTIQLANQGLATDLTDLIPESLPGKWRDPNGRWAAFSLRARVLVYNTDMLGGDNDEQPPTSLKELTDPKWRGRVAMANPLFGTTAAHMAALTVLWGEEETDRWLNDLKANGLRLVEGNSVVRDVVARGEVAVGLTDTDDVFAGMAEDMTIDFLLPDQDGMGTFAMPNSVIRIAGGPHPEGAEAFIRYLLGEEVERMMAFSRARHIPVREGVEHPEELDRFEGLVTMEVDYNEVAALMEETAKRMERIFLINAE